MPFSFHPCPISGLLIIEPRTFPDERGFFMETFKATDFVQAGIPEPFLQDNHSLSVRGALRGLHFQRPPHAQGKLVRVCCGRSWNVAVDLRTDSPSFGRWQGLELSAENRLMFWIPVGFAHGFLSLEDNTELQYKCTAEFHGPSESGLRWDDPTLAIAWPELGVTPLLSAKDMALPGFEPSVKYFQSEF